MGGVFGDIIVIITTSLGTLFLLAVILRFLLQAVRADFYNPITQAIVKVTAKPVALFRRIIPGYRGLDLASLVLALVVNTIATIIMISAVNAPMPSFGQLISWSLMGVFGFILNIYYFGTLISVIASFIAPFSGNPILLMIYQILEPLNGRIRRIIPPMGGLDLSPLFVFLGITVLEKLLFAVLVSYLGFRAGYAPFVLGI